MTNKTKLAAGNDLSDYTWNMLMDDLRAAGLFEDYFSTCISATQEAAEERMRYAGRRMTSKNYDLYCDDEHARFALNVKALRRARYTITSDDLLNRPRHWLVAYALAEKLEARS